MSRVTHRLDNMQSGAHRVMTTLALASSACVSYAPATPPFQFVKSRLTFNGTVTRFPEPPLISWRHRESRPSIALPGGPNIET